MSSLSGHTDGLRDKLMPFQRQGVQYAIEKQGRCLIGDEMGLGKTIQAIAVAYYYRAEWPLLVVLPSSMKYPWIEELEKWLPCLQPRDVNLITSSTDISNISRASISLIGYGLMRGSYKTLQEALHKQDFKVIILDESHFLKNPKAARTKTLIPLLTKAKRVLMLSGTPALARPAELYPQINCLTGGQFGSWSSFAKRYCDAKWKFFGRIKKWDTMGASNLPELHEKLTATVMIRREKREVLPQLPPKRRQKVPFELAESPQKKELELLWTDLGLYLRGETPVDNAGADAGFEIRRLAMQLYISTGKAKIGAMSEYIKMLLDNPEMKFLVFAHHKELLTAVVQTVQAYAREKEPSLKYIRIDGDVPPAERMKDVNRFQKDPNVRVAALSIMAAGTGLTLTAASHVVFAELHWTPGVLEQCEDRAHRIGQLNAIHVHYLVAKGTIDEWMWSALNRKVGVLSSTLNGRVQQLDAEVLQGGISDFLKQAAFWLPSELDEEEEDSYFFSQTQKESRDIRSYLQPSQSRRKTLTLEDRFKDEPSPVISLVDSDESDGEVSTNQTLPTTRKEPDQAGGEIDSFSESEAEISFPVIIDDENEAKESQNLPKTVGKGATSHGVISLKNMSPRLNSVASVDGREVGQVSSAPACLTTRSIINPSPHTSIQQPNSQMERGCQDGTATPRAFPSRPGPVACGSITSAGNTPQEQLQETELQRRIIIASSDPTSGIGDRLHDSGSSDSDCELVVGTQSSSRKRKGSQRSQQQSSGYGGTPSSSCGTPSSALDRRRKPHDSVCLTPTTNRSDNHEEQEYHAVQWNCPACTFLNHQSLPLCEICDTPRRRAERQRRINTRSRVVPEQSGKESKSCAVLRNLMGSDEDDFEVTQRVVQVTSSTRKKSLKNKQEKEGNDTSGPEEPSNERDGPVAEALLDSVDDDYDFEAVQRVVQLESTTKRKSRNSLGSKQENDNNDLLVPERFPDRKDCPDQETHLGTSDDDDFEVVPGVVRLKSKVKRRKSGNSSRSGGTTGCPKSSGVEEDNELRRDHGLNGDTVQNSRAGDMDRSLDHGIDISDSDSDDSFLKVDVLRMDSQDDNRWNRVQRDESKRSLISHDGRLGSTSGTAQEELHTNPLYNQETSRNLPGKGCRSAESVGLLSNQDDSSGTLSDALFSDEEDSEPLDQKSGSSKGEDHPAQSSQMLIEKEVKAAVQCVLMSPRGSGSKVKPWTCAELSCKFVNISSGVECENCWAPNPNTEEAPLGAGGNAKVHNPGLRKSPGFISASDLLAEQGSKPSCSLSKGDGSQRGDEEDIAEREQRKPLPEPKTYEAFLYCASKYTERIYLYDMDQKPLDCAFQPLDLRTRDLDILPRLLQVPHNMRVARVFLREWDMITAPLHHLPSLTELKKRKLRKSGLIFDSPTAAVEALMKKRPFELSKRRFLTKDDLANAALQKAEEVGGSIRVIHRKKAGQALTSPPRAANLQFVKSPVGDSRKRKGVMSGDSTGGEDGSESEQESAKRMRRDADDGTEEDAGLMVRSSFVQAVNADGTPLCVFCNSPVETANLSNCNAAWDTRYCSENCKQEYQIRWRNSKYVRQQLLEAEHGSVSCASWMHTAYTGTSDVPKSKLKDFLSKTAYSSLSSKLLNEIIKNPSEGQFWHADHIVPVYKGGGLCSLENFRTLCVLCHSKVTAEQSRERKDTRTLEANKKAGLRDIRGFFKDQG